jgi:DNA-directed RNA polymerase subunit beta'
MMTTQNMFSPSNGKPILTPFQDIILGVYYLTSEPQQKEGRIPLMGSVEAVLMAEVQGAVTTQDWIHLANPDSGRVTRYGNYKDRIIKTTVERVIFNQIFPRSLGFINFSVSNGMLGNLSMGTHKIIGQHEAVQMLDRLKNLGFQMAMKAGFLIGVDDMTVPSEKRDPKVAQKTWGIFNVRTRNSVLFELNPLSSLYRTGVSFHPSRISK